MKDTSKKPYDVDIMRATSVSVQTDGGRFDYQPGLTTKPEKFGGHPPAVTHAKKQLQSCNSKPTKSAHRAGAILWL